MGKMYFNDKDGNLYEGDSPVRPTLYEEYRRCNKDKKVKVRNCSTDRTEEKTVGELCDHSIWRNIGYIAVVLVLVVVVGACVI